MIFCYCSPLRASSPPPAASPPPAGCIASYTQNKIYEVLGPNNIKAWLHNKGGGTWDGCLSLSQCQWNLDNIQLLLPSLQPFISNGYHKTRTHHSSIGWYSTQHSTPSIGVQLNIVNQLLLETVGESCRALGWSQKTVLSTDIGSSKFLVFRLNLPNSCLEFFVRQTDASSVLSAGASCSTNIQNKAQKFNNELLTSSSMVWITTSDLNKGVSIQLSKNGSGLAATDSKTFGLSSPSYAKQWLKNIIDSSITNLKLDIRDDPLPSEKSDTSIKRLLHWIAAASYRIELNRSDPKSLAARRWSAESAKQGDIALHNTHFRVEKIN